MFEPFKFKPAHQPEAEKPVEFELRPLDNPMLFRLTKAYGSDEGLSYDDLQMILAKSVTGWTGLPQEFTPQSKAALLTGPGNIDVLFWLSQCAQELYNRAALKEPERKNS